MYSAIRPSYNRPLVHKINRLRLFFVCNDVILGFQLTGRYNKNGYFNVVIEFRDSLRLKDKLSFSFSCYDHFDRRKIVHKLMFDCPSSGWKAVIANKEYSLHSDILYSNTALATATATAKSFSCMNVKKKTWRKKTNSIKISKKPVQSN